jgi:Ran GTPase-activating protein (RanGAP) involved in mRNA processing and transport
VRVLCINRKQLGDEEGIELAKNLQYNTYLERVDLESNNIGPKFLEQLAHTVTKNNTIRSIDLEGNNLTNGNNFLSLSKPKISKVTMKTGF